MPWNFFITPANYWELKLGTSSESVADSFGGNFSSLEVSNNTGMYFEKIWRVYFGLTFGLPEHLGQDWVLCQVNGLF